MKLESTIIAAIAADDEDNPGPTAEVHAVLTQERWAEKLSVNSFCTEWWPTLGIFTLRCLSSIGPA